MLTLSGRRDQASADVIIQLCAQLLSLRVRIFGRWGGGSSPTVKGREMWPVTAYLLHFEFDQGCQVELKLPTDAVVCLSAGPHMANLK